jgi:hypothetical protein
MSARIFTFLIIVLLPLNVAANKDMARIITDTSKPVECIAPIDVYNIDSKLVRKNAMGFNLEPGKHTLVGTARIDGRNCPSMRGAARDIPPLEHEFKAGHTYFIGLNHKAAGQQDWFFTVWRVQEPKAGK